MQLIAQTPLDEPLRRWWVSRRRRRELRNWEQTGRGVPVPHLLKQRVLLEHSRRFDLRVLVETGTYLGDMVEATKRDFDHVYSIELSPDLYRRGEERFRRDANVELILGDSGRELGALIPRLPGPALFWLDGHYSAGITAMGDKTTPIEDELRHILGSGRSSDVIIIDDARCFGSEAGYPTLEQLEQLIRGLRADIDIAVEDDSIRVTPRR